MTALEKALGDLADAKDNHKKTKSGKTRHLLQTAKEKVRELRREARTGE